VITGFEEKGGSFIICGKSRDVYRFIFVQFNLKGVGMK
jgi:hypothetical protein